MTRGIRRALIVGVAVGVGVMFGAGTAFAHIEPDPPAIESGTSATVSFGVEHGCEGSPTVGLDFQVPENVTDAQPVAKDGWTTSVVDRVVSFSDGNLDPETPDEFSITFTAPAEAGTIYFPVVQKCATGETPWIEIPASGAAESEHPAPAIKVTDGPPTADDLAAEHDEDEATDDSAEGDHHTEEADSDDSDDDTNTGVIVGVAIAVVVVGAGAAVLITRRRKGSSGTAE